MTVFPFCFTITVSVGVIQLIQSMEEVINLVVINPSGNTPLYEQIVNSIKSNFAKGYLKPGDEIPSVRKLAMELSVTPNTVAKAYQELERDKIIVTIRGKGTYISKDAGVTISDERMETLRKNLMGNIVELTCMGMEQKEIVKLVEEIYSEIREEK